MAAVATAAARARQASQPELKLALILAALVGKTVQVTLTSPPRELTAIVGSAVTASDGQLSVTLRQAHTPSKPRSVTPSLTVTASELVSIEAMDVSLASAAAGGGGASASAADSSFKTDSQVTGQGPHKRERQLQAWGTDPGIGGSSLDDDTFGALSLDDSASSTRGWDQFAANERLHGVRSDYDEELYTTKLDRTSADYKERERRAAQLEKEILRATGTALTGNAHMAEERNVVDDSLLNEEDRYGAVIRAPGAYVPPAARKAVSTSTSPANVPSTDAAAAQTTTNGKGADEKAAAAAAADPSIISISSRLPVPASGTSRIPSTAAAAAAAAGSNRPDKSSVPSLDTSFRQFVSNERQRLTEKKQALAKAAARQDKDSKLASLLEFSQTFKLPVPTPPDIAEIAGHDPAKLAAKAAAAAKDDKKGSTTASAPKAPEVVDGASAPAAAKPSSAWSKSKLNLEIPPFNPNKATNKAAEAVKPTSSAELVKATNGASTSTSKSAATSSASTPAPAKVPTSRINANAPAFVFRPNPNATSFTPGASTSRKPVEAPMASAATTAAHPPSAPAVPVNPFFGNKPIKKGSMSMHVKEDFTPFKNAVVPDPTFIVPAWSFTGKPYRSLLPVSPSPTPTPLSQSVTSSSVDDDSQTGGSGPLPVHATPILPGVSPPAHHAPPPPLGQFGGMYVQQYAQQPPGPQFARLGPHGQPAMHAMPSMNGAGGNALQFQQFGQPGMPFGQPSGPPHLFAGAPHQQPMPPPGQAFAPRYGPQYPY
ncbi:hypothetical protein ACM66B_004812 [Microbotryomycetes sp. NB124-2]